MSSLILAVHWYFDIPHAFISESAIAMNRLNEPCLFHVKDESRWEPESLLEVALTHAAIGASRSPCRAIEAHVM